ncbi:NF038122 family metalloprotease [Methylomonas sp. AM2-LC]|uniref:NF038122 family metalloprotease n=1 Tax=Methylomonas sp. AM2-LC TaxID=3153301 RepID=UPI003267288D
MFTMSDSHAMTIQANYDDSVTTQEINAFNEAIQLFDRQFVNDITVNINVNMANSSAFLGQTTSYLLQYNNNISNYTTIANALTAANTNLILPGVSHIAAQVGNADYLDITLANAKALGLIAANDSGLDGAITLSSYYAWNTGSNGSVPADEFDLVGVAEHEISEVLGRISGLSVIDSRIMPLDLLRYTGSAPTGVLDFSTAVSNSYYLSLDGGKTSLASLNAIPGNDLGDFDGSVVSDPFNAFSNSGQFNTLNKTDYTVMQALGYQLVPIALPSAFWLFFTSCLGIRLFRK